MKKVKRRIAVLALALVAIIGLPIGVYAAGNFAVAKIDKYYIVDAVKSETTVDGVRIQQIERRYIPENRYNPNAPNVPYSSGTGYWDGNGNYINNGQNPCYPGYNPNYNPQGNWTTWDEQTRTSVLRNVGIASLESVKSYGTNPGRPRNWTITYGETFGSSAEVDFYLECYCNNSTNVDRRHGHFTVKVYFDEKYNPTVRYYQDGTNGVYTEPDIKTMFDKEW